MNHQAKAKAMSKALRPYVDTVLLSMAHSQLWREQVDAMERDILTADTYYTDPRWVKKDAEPERITDPKQAYLLRDEDFATYYAECQRRIKAAGWPVTRDGNCPALEAESLQMEAEHALIEAAREWFPNASLERLTQGTANKNGLETLKEYLDLLIKLVVNAPGYVSPLKRTA